MSKTKRKSYETVEEDYKQLSYTPVCDEYRHLVCLPYSVDNLHALAKEMGIGRSWFHEGRLPHYDIPKKRVDEIKSMCMKVSPKIIVKIIRGTTNLNEIY